MKAKDRAEKMAAVNIPCRYASGTRSQLEPKWKAKHIDEYTSGGPPMPFIQEAMVDELKYVCEHVLAGVPEQEALDTSARIIGTMCSLQ